MGSGGPEAKAEAQRWYSEAITRYRAAAENGDAEAAYQLGGMYSSIDSMWSGIPNDSDESEGWYAKAHALFQAAAEAGDAEAASRLGDIYYLGYGVPENDVEAKRWYAEALSRFQSAAAVQGDGEAAYRLGWMYHDGDAGPEDHAEGERWLAKAAELYRAAAEQNDPEAAYRLGNLYVDGEGVSEDEDEARRWHGRAATLYRAAAEQGDPKAAYRLSRMYVAQDAAEAVKWFEAAGTPTGSEAQPSADQNAGSQRCYFGECEAGSEKPDTVARTPEAEYNNTDIQPTFPSSPQRFDLNNQPTVSKENVQFALQATGAYFSSICNQNTNTGCQARNIFNQNVHECARIKQANSPTCRLAFAGTMTVACLSQRLSSTHEICEAAKVSLNQLCSDGIGDSCAALHQFN
jgi:TPR repeat protein